MKHRISESLLRVINEEMGIATLVKNETNRLLDFIGEYSNKILTKGNKKKIANGVETVTFHDIVQIGDYKIKVYFHFVLYRDKQCEQDFKQMYRFPNPTFNKEDNIVEMYVDVVNGKINYVELGRSLQHELSHSYQKCSAIKNNKGKRDISIHNTNRYNMARANMMSDNKYLRWASQAVYLYGTNEASAYANGLYATLVQSYKTNETNPIMFPTIVSEDSISIMYSNIEKLYNKLLNDEIEEIDFILQRLGISEKRKLIGICRTVLKRVQQFVRRAIRKATLDVYDMIENNKYTQD